MDNNKPFTLLYCLIGVNICGCTWMAVKKMSKSALLQ